MDEAKVNITFLTIFYVSIIIYKLYCERLIPSVSCLWWSKTSKVNHAFARLYSKWCYLLPLKGQIGSVEQKERLVWRLRWVDPIKLPVSVGESIQLASYVSISRRTYIRGARRRLAIRRRSTLSRARSRRCATVRGRRRSGRVTDDVDNDYRPYPNPDTFSHCCYRDDDFLLRWETGRNWPNVGMDAYLSLYLAQAVVWASLSGASDFI